MYLCISCGGSVENIDSQCFCGKTSTDLKGKIDGENYVKIDRQDDHEKTKVRTCPHCGWRGLVIPRIERGCPEHGLWYKNTEENQPIIEKEETKDADTDLDQGPLLRGKVNGSPRPRFRRKGKLNQKRKIVPRYNNRGYVRKPQM